MENSNEIAKTELYLAETTTNDKWEVSQGVYIVSATSEEQARELVKSVCRGEEIISIEIIKPATPGVIFEQNTIVE